MNYKKIIYIFIVLLLDQATKCIIGTSNFFYEVIPDFFYIDYTSNTGAAFSILSGHNIILVLLTIALCVMIYHIMYSYKESKLNNAAFGLMFGGILGNLADRLFIGYVRDFISFKFGSVFFPTFNVADMAICIGALLLIISSIKEELNKDGNKSRRSKRKKTR